MEIKNNWSGEIPAKSYQEFKGMVDKELNQAAEGFVRIGYLLKVARDTNILYESGYKSVAEFALHEYGLSKDIVSRYIAINDRYSQGGYSDVLASQYQGYGMAKLAEMLVLPDNLVELIPAELTKTEIREIKKEYAQEQQVSDIELAIEAAEHPDERTLGEQILYEYFKENPDEYIGLPGSTEDIVEYMLPAESKTIICQVPGKGRLLLSLTKSNVRIGSMRGDVTEYWSWNELCRYIRSIAPAGDRKELWSNLYDLPYPEPEKPPADKPTNKPEKKAEASKVSIVKKEAKVAPVQPVKAAEQEMKKPEITEESSHEPESLENTELEAISISTCNERMQELKTKARLKLNEIDDCIITNQWVETRQHTKELLSIINEMMILNGMRIIDEE